MQHTVVTVVGRTILIAFPPPPRARPGPLPPPPPRCAGTQPQPAFQTAGWVGSKGAPLEIIGPTVATCSCEARPCHPTFCPHSRSLPEHLLPTCYTYLRNGSLYPCTCPAALCCLARSSQTLLPPLDDFAAHYARGAHMHGPNAHHTALLHLLYQPAVTRGQAHTNSVQSTTCSSLWSECTPRRRPDRWDPCRDHAQVLIVGGFAWTDPSNKFPPKAEVWDPATPDSARFMTTARDHPAGYRTFMTGAYYPFIMTLPKGAQHDWHGRCMSHMSLAHCAMLAFVFDEPPHPPCVLLCRPRAVVWQQGRRHHAVQGRLHDNPRQFLLQGASKFANLCRLAPAPAHARPPWLPLCYPLLQCYLCLCVATAYLMIVTHTTVHLHACAHAYMHGCMRRALSSTLSCLLATITDSIDSGRHAMVIKSSGHVAAVANGPLASRASTIILTYSLPLLAFAPMPAHDAAFWRAAAHVSRDWRRYVPRLLCALVAGCCVCSVCMG